MEIENYNVSVTKLTTYRVKITKGDYKTIAGKITVEMLKNLNQKYVQSKKYEKDRLCYR